MRLGKGLGTNLRLVIPAALGALTRAAAAPAALSALVPEVLERRNGRVLHLANHSNNNMNKNDK